MVRAVSPPADAAPIIEPTGQVSKSERIPLRLAETLPFLVVAVGFILSLRQLTDPDIWWHLRTGMSLLDGHWLTTDPWGFATTNDHPWVLHEWLSEVIFAVGYKIAGYNGVIIVRALGFSAILATIAWRSRRVSDPFIATVIATVAALGMLASSGERPQLVSFLMLACLGPMWLQRLRADRAPPWWSLAVIWLWANMHGLWASGIVLYGVLALTAILRLGWRRRSLWAPILWYGVAAVGVVAVTPAGPRLLLAPLQVRGYAEFVTEWAAPSIVALPALALVVLLGIILLSWARSTDRQDPLVIAYVATATVLGLMYLRTVPVGCVLLAPLAAAAWQGMLRRDAAVPPTGRLATRTAAVTVAVTSVISVGILMWVPAIPANAPYSALSAMSNVNPEARVLNEYDLGGWLLWANPSLKPAIDGRTELYSVKYVRDYLAAGNLRGDWEGFVEGLDVDAAWLRKDTPLVIGLRDILGWKVAYEDDWSIVLTPPQSPSQFSGP